MKVEGAALFSLIVYLLVHTSTGVTDGNTWTEDKDGGDKNEGTKNEETMYGRDRDGVSADHRVDVKPGDDALLPCRAPGDENIKLVDWQRVGLNTSPADILVIRDGKKLPDQHPSVHGRVELKNPQMKNRDVSVTLKNVTINDTGTYECRVKTDRTIGSPPELINTIQLRVNHSGEFPVMKTGEIVEIKTHICFCFEGQPEDSEDDGAKNEGAKNEGPKNEGPKHEGPSDPIAVLKLLCILFGPPLVIVLCLSVLGIVCGILADCQEACSTELMEVIPV